MRAVTEEAEASIRSHMVCKLVCFQAKAILKHCMGAQPGNHEAWNDLHCILIHATTDTVQQVERLYTVVGSGRGHSG